jgi:hypothetical protein
VLSLDADYVLTPELAAEIQSLTPDSEADGYAARFYYNVYGTRLRSTLYPPRTVLYRRTKASYHNEGHGHRVTVAGENRNLAAKIDHDDRNPLSRWIRSQDRYAKVEAQYLRELENKRKSGSAVTLSFPDRLRLKIYFAPWIMFIYLLLGRGLILDGWQGWYYVIQRTIAEALLSLQLLTDREKLETDCA